TGVNDKIVASGTNSLTATGSQFNLTENVAGNVIAGNNYVLLTYNGTALDNTVYTSIVNASTIPLLRTVRYNFTNDTANTRVTLDIAAGPTWNLNANGNWSVDANWTPVHPNGIGDVA